MTPTGFILTIAACLIIVVDLWNNPQDVSAWLLAILVSGALIWDLFAAFIGIQYTISWRIRQLVSNDPYFAPAMCLLMGHFLCVMKRA